MVEVGKTVPDFTLPSSNGQDFQLSKQDSAILLYFYPKDNTPGCTLESIAFNKYLADFNKLNVKVVGVSRDSVKSHCSFISKFDFKFELLSDEDESLCKQFDVIKEKNMYGKMVLGIERSTFIIGADKKLIAEFRKVKADGHAEEMLGFVKKLG